MNKLPPFQKRLNEWIHTCLTQKLHLYKKFTLFSEAKKALKKGQEYAALKVLIKISQSNYIDSDDIAYFIKLEHNGVYVETTI